MMTSFLTNARTLICLTLISLLSLLGPILAMDATDQLPFRLVSLSKEMRLSQRLPKTESLALQKIFNSGLIWYTDDEMPRCYQNSGGVHSVYYNISAGKNDPPPRTEPYGNANLEFPWGETAGLERTEGVKVYKFMHLPKGRAITYGLSRDGSSMDHDSYYHWSYPQGTVFGEVLVLSDPEGREHTFEVRIRSKTATGWQPDIFRPFVNAVQLENRLAQIDKAEPSDFNRKLLGHLRSPIEPLRLSLRNKHPVEIFSGDAAFDVLPWIPSATVSLLLEETPFQSALSQDWRPELKQLNTAPTTSANYHIIPKGYSGAFFKLGRDACMKCHETTGNTASSIEMFREWYGRVRGSDAIFSWYPFDPSCLSDNGMNRPVTMRRVIADSGYLRRE